VRSMTFTFTAFSSAFSCAGDSSPSQMTVSAPVATTTSRSSAALPSRCRSTDPAVTALDEAFEHLRTGGFGQGSQLGHAGLVVGGSAFGPHPTRTTRSSRSWRYSTSETSASSVDSPATRRSAAGRRARVRRCSVLRRESNRIWEARVGRFWICHGLYPIVARCDRPRSRIIRCRLKSERSASSLGTPPSVGELAAGHQHDGPARSWSRR